MELTNNLIDAAEKILRFEGAKNLPKQIEGTAMYLADAKDETILACGVINWKSVEYKIGTKK